MASQVLIWSCLLYTSQWLVDPEAADVVKRIFAMTIEGYGPYQIASKLKAEKVLIPVSYTHLGCYQSLLEGGCASNRACVLPRVISQADLYA